MENVIKYIVWPAVAGMVFGFVLLQLPRVAEWIPGLDLYLAQNSADSESEPLSFADAFSKSAPAVVSINSTSDIAIPINQVFNPFARNPKLYRRDESTNLGSGVIISPDGYIITSYHIIELNDPNTVPDPESPFPQIEVTLYNGESMEARVIIVDEDNDLALLKVNAMDLAYLSPADEGSYDVGDMVLAIGNPRNIGQSMTQGIISALLKTDQGYVIQTDAAINPGNSGGALIDTDGRLIGINSTIVTESGGYEGISFAVPSQNAFRLKDYYIESGPGGFLGVDGRFITRVASNILLDGDVEGLWIERLSKNGPADAAGIQVNDVIVQLEDIQITNDTTALAAIQTVSRLGPGETISARVFRGGEYIDFSVVLGVGEAIIYYSESEPLLDPNPFEERLIEEGLL